MNKLKNMKEIFNYILWGNSLKQYFISLTIFIVLILILWLIKKMEISHLKKLINKTQSEVKYVIIKCLKILRWPFYTILSLWIALQFIKMPAHIHQYFSYFVLIIVVYYLVKIALELINFWTNKIIQKKKESEAKVDTSAIHLLNTLAKILIWIIAILIVLQNLGINITALIAGLGIGGLALALALQSILSDILACFSIYFDRPFEIGDSINVGDVTGIVKKIGLQSTRLLSVTGEEIIISNKELTKNKIKNYRKMQKRISEFTFVIKYETPVEKLKKIPKIVEEIIKSIELCEFQGAHFQKFGEYGLIFDVVFNVSTPDYNRYLDIQEKINLDLKEALEKEKIDFAYLTQNNLKKLFKE